MYQDILRHIEQLQVVLADVGTDVASTNVAIAVAEIATTLRETCEAQTAH